MLKGKMKKLKEKAVLTLNSFLSYTPEILFVTGLTVTMFGLFMIGVIIGTIATGAALVVLSFLVGGE